MIGGLARVLRGSDEVTAGLDVVPSARAENLRRLAAAVDELDADGATVTDSRFADAALTAPLIELSTRAGRIKVVPEPPGTRRGYDDLRRAATREPIGKGLRPLVASVGDLARTLAALGREVDQPRLRTLRRLSELERHLALEL